ncbi:hypothetical protein [Lacipirellula sp.]|uniref:hypothetical protein n=1 Tax=Lacipirellula sp. TaxID=2691419 RepID=UPI003D133BC4
MDNFTRTVNRGEGASAFVRRLNVKNMTDDERISLADELLSLDMPIDSILRVTGVLFEVEKTNANN